MPPLNYHLSIITPSLNPGRLILETCRSLAEAVETAKRARPDLLVEQLIFDDGSEDQETLACYESIEESFSFVRILYGKQKRQGPAKARNSALHNARGDWIGFIDADDLVDSEGFAQLVQIALSNESANWVFGETTAFYEDGHEEHKPSYFRRIVAVDSARCFTILSKQLTSQLAGPPNLFLGSMLVRRPLLIDCGGFDSSLMFAEDWYLTLQLSLQTSAVFLPKTVQRLRRGHASLTQSDRSLSLEPVRATVRVLMDSRFSRVRKTLRWTLLTQLIHIRDRNYIAEHYWRSFGIGLLALLVAPDELKLLKEAFSKLLNRK